MPMPGERFQRMTRRSGFGYGSGRSRSALATVKTAALAPTPIASESITDAVKPRLRRRPRRAWRMSRAASFSEMDPCAMDDTMIRRPASARRDDAHVSACGLVRGEAEEAPALLLERRPVAAGGTDEGLHGEDGAAALVRDPPPAAREAVEEDGAEEASLAREARHDASFRNDTAPVLVPEEHVVVAGQEARRRGRVGRRTRSTRPIEQLAPAPVPKDPQPRPQALDDLTQPGKPGPRPHVRDARRTESVQVALDEASGRDGSARRAAEKGLHGQPRRTPGRAPDAARRHLHERHEVLHGVTEGARVPVRPPLLQEGRDFRAGPRLVLQEGPARGRDPRRARARERPPESAVERAREHRLHERPEGEVVAGGDEVQRSPHHHRAKGATPLDQASELGGAKPREARPQPEVWTVGNLGLQAHEVLDRLLRRPPRARE